jgi:triacylglycerol esterase/lipase EstA (alpha/beta hydrolase family)
MSPRRRLLLIGTVSAAVIALAVVLGVRLFGGDDRSGRADQSRPGTVLLVPGYGGNQRSLAQLAERLRAAGRTAVVVTPPGDGTGDLREQADTLDDAVRNALDDDAPSVDIVGYSAGGVVTRIWLDRHDGEAVARRIVTLGSPHHGARIAAAGVALNSDACQAACRQLAPGSDLLADLDDNRPTVPWLSVWTENDETVQPPDSARVDGAVNLSLQSLCPGVTVSHSQLPTDPLVTALVLKALGTEPLAVPDSCADLTTT